MAITKSTMEENLNVIQNNLRPLYGNSFIIKPEGVIDNIAVGVSGIKMDFEDQLLFLKQNLNPFTATGIYQDGLYSLRELKRRQSTYTLVQRTIEGAPNAIVRAGTLLIENASTKDQFQLDDDVTLDASGIATGTFKSLLIGSVDLPASAVINILTPVAEVYGVYYTANNDINIGVDYEQDSEFRKQFENVQKVYDRMEIALLQLVDNAGDLRVIQNRGVQIYPEIPIRTKQITIFSAASDQTIAKTIFENMVDSGFDLDGSIVVTVQDAENQDVEIRFNRAKTVEVYLRTKVKKMPNASDSEVMKEVVDAIQAYLNANSFAMGDTVVGNRLDSWIDAKPSVDYVDETLLSTDNVNWIKIIELEPNQMPLLTTARTEVIIE